jgi:hypothetical protein
MRLPVPIKSSIIDRQSELLQTVKAAQKKGQSAKNKFRSSVLTIVAAHRFSFGAELAEKRRKQRRLSKFRTGVWVVVAIARMRKGVGGQSMIDEVSTTRNVLAALTQKQRSSNRPGSPSGKRDASDGQQQATASSSSSHRKLSPAAVAKK